VEQNGVFISIDKRGKLADAIDRITNSEEGSLCYVLNKYVHALLDLLTYLQPFVPKRQKINIDGYYVLSDEIKMNYLGRAYKLESKRQLEVLCKYSNEIADVISKYNSAKAEIIREIPSFDWTRWGIGEIKLNHGMLRYCREIKDPFDNFKFGLRYIPYERLDYVTLSEFLSKNKKPPTIKKIGVLEYDYYYIFITPALHIYEIKEDNAMKFASLIYSTDMYSSGQTKFYISLELYPMADKLIEFFKDMENGMSIYKQEFERKLKRLEDINAMHGFKATLEKLRE